MKRELTLVRKGTGPLVAVTCFSLLTVAAATGSPQEVSGFPGRSSELVAGPIVRALGSADRAGEIVYEAHCVSSPNGDTFAFPRLKTRTWKSSLTPPDAIRDFLRDNDNVSVVVKKSGVVLVQIGAGRNEMLDWKVRALSLSQDERFTPQLILDALVANVDVRTLLDKRNLRQIRSDSIFPLQPANPSRPHLPRTIRNIRFGDVLESVALNFKAVVLFGRCKTEPFFDLRIVRLPG